MIAKINRLNKLATHKDYKIHFKTFIEAVNGLFWVFNFQSPKYAIESAVESSEFHALKLKQLKIPEQTQWYTHFIESIKSLKPYILQNFPTGLFSAPSQGERDYKELIEQINNNVKLEETQSNGGQQQPSQQQQSDYINQQQQQQNKQPEEQSYPSLQQYLDNLNKFETLSKEINKDLIKDITNIAIKVAKDKFLIVMKNFQSHKKPAEDVKKQLMQEFIVDLKKLQEKSVGDAQIYVKPVYEGLQALFWIFQDQMPKMIVETSIEASEFNALKLKKQKIQLETDWYMSFHAALKFLVGYISENFKAGLSWNPQGSQDHQNLINQLKGQQNQVVTKQNAGPPSLNSLGLKGTSGGPPPLGSLNLNLNQNTDNNKKSTNAGDSDKLFSQINVGMDDIKKHLRKTNKDQLKEEAKLREQKLQEKLKQKQEQQEPKVQTQSVSQQQATKEPKRYLKPMQGLYLENFQNVQELIEIKEGDDGLESKHALFLDNCKKIAVKVHPKINTIFINKCENLQLQFNQVISSVQLVNANSITIWCFEKCPSIQCDNSQQVHISLMDDMSCEVISSNTQEINVTYKKTEDEMAKDYPIPEQFITKWDPNQHKFVTSVFEQDL
ncbi:Adenylate cyclase-associated CAP, N-terminal [Pseudocohnilembus persalinus]|uniref:Adenylate cyclase-associated CAP, N-terminal n=1 Tax=Pseudocohnilembus persalinus TaxID=266149 RepID=A0A0V0Q9T8_PSEPJ|nr:Adenylate cyclase-associated CAP, N-terminal [Pseudocohnilembus persalinus]|eukprot:KRW98962.1 Adenylate cyclase-associated CAP, N-terminal [Pseudocohnilembus persalinus]